MLYTIAFALLLLWLVSLVSHNALGGFVHVLLAAAIVIMLLNLIARRKSA
jgi:hypothetical protein